MKHRVTWLAVLPLAMALANIADAGFRCGGCSDPCRPARVPHCGRSGGLLGGGMSSGYANGYSVLQASPTSCGAVAADGSYGMMAIPTYSQAPSVVMQSPTVMMQAPSMVMQAPAAVSTAPQTVCEPVTGYRTVMESTFVTETQYVPASETKQETRFRVKTVSKSVPVTFEDFRVKTVMVPTTETKTIEYSVLVPEQSTKTVDVTVTVPVWNEVSENYTVKVPVVSDVQESYNVSVPRLRDESYSYTVYAPQTETVTKMQTVTNAVPVVKTRTVQRSVPSYSTQTVSKDFGHWETVVEEVAGSSYGAAPMTYSAPEICAAPATYYAAPTSVSYAGGCGTVAMASSVVSGGGCGKGLFGRRSRGCGCAAKSSCGCSAPAAASSCGCGSAGSSGCGSSSGCGGSMIVRGSIVSGSMVGGYATGSCGTTYAGAVAPATSTATRRVWVPNVVTEEVQVVSNETRNEEVAYTVYEQQSTQIPYECAYVVYRPEPRTGTRKVVEYVSEPRTRTRKVVSYNDETRTRTRRELSYKTEVKQETYPIVTYKTEKKTKEISFTIQVPTQTVEPFQSTRYETVTEDVSEEYTVSIQVPTTKEVQVQVCKMVPKLVPYTFHPCATSGSSVGGAVMSGSVGGCGCGSTAPTASGCGCGSPTPAAPGCGCGR